MQQNQTQEKSVQPLNIQDRDSLSFFVRDIQKFPMLEAQEEYLLATRWHQENDPKAMNKLLSSHLRLVFKIAQGYRGYGLPLHDLVAEGNIGLMQALNKFNPDKGFRFSTYAMWWIRAAMQEYILKNWSMVKLGTTAAQKKLFFNLKRVRSQVDNDERHLSDETIQQIAKNLDVSEQEVMEMSQRMQSQDYSLNAFIADAGEGEWQDWLECPEQNQETNYLQRKEMEERQTLLEKAMQSLSAREHEVLKYRRLHEPPKTLEELSVQFKLSKERVRQIEVAAFHKLQTEARKHTKEQVYH
jgi:RNA polymerase sigma-32 factor